MSGCRYVAVMRMSGLSKILALCHGTALIVVERKLLACRSLEQLWLHLASFYASSSYLQDVIFFMSSIVSLDLQSCTLRDFSLSTKVETARSIDAGVFSSDKLGARI